MFYNPHILPKVYKPFFEERFTREDLEKHIADEIKRHPDLLEFLKPFHETSHERFIENYAIAKANVILDLDNLRTEVDGVDTIFTKFAAERIWDIQQKKLFDLQCQWRAELITIPEIESTWDFKYWEDDIELCPFLTPISASDLELYSKFLRECPEELYVFSWQDYDEFKINFADDNRGTDLPDWYIYHNTYTGNGTFMTLPDIRGNKEEYYANIWRREQNINTRNSPYIPVIHFSDDKHRELFLNQFEEKRFIKKYDEYLNLKNQQNSNDRIDDAIRFLLNWHIEIPIQANSDWRTAIFEAKRIFVNEKTADALTTVYDEYLMRQNMNLPHKEKPDDNNRAFIKSLGQFTLNGRKIAGEPEDFNF